MAYIDSLEIEGRGNFKVLATLDYDTQRDEVVDILWVDKNSHYFVGNSEGTDLVEPMYRTHWRQVSEEPNPDPDRVKLKNSHNKMIQNTMISRL